MAITIRDVAKRAGVGIATVSRVLNQNPNVSPTTRNRVVAAISELNFVPNSMARRLSTGRNYTIGLIVPFSTRPAAVERMRGVVTSVSDSEYELIIYNVERWEQRKHYFQEGGFQERLDGLVIVSAQLDDEEANYLLSLKLPIVLIDGYHPRLNCIYIDDVLGGYQATRHLIELGHRRIAYLSDFVQPTVSEGVVGNTAMYDRLLGYRQALREASIPFNPLYHAQIIHSKQAAYLSAIDLLKQTPRPTAIFAASDTEAIGVLQAARELKIAVPEQLSVIGYDDIDVAELLYLTTINQSLVHSGELGGQFLLGMLNKESGEIRPMQLPTQVIVRKTTAPPPANS